MCAVMNEGSIGVDVNVQHNSMSNWRVAYWGGDPKYCVGFFQYWSSTTVTILGWVRTIESN